MDGRKNIGIHRNTASSGPLPMLMIGIAVAGTVACVSPSQVPPTGVAMLDADRDGVLDPYEALDRLLSIERELGRPVSVQDLRDYARDEWAAGMQAFDAFRRAFDFDGDGIVTVRELEEHAAEGDEEMVFSARMFDSDGDGTISAEEMLYGGTEEAFFLSADEIAAELDLLFSELTVDRDGAIEMQIVPGSIDDHANLRAAHYVRDHRLATALGTNARIASGGTDFFLAGRTRTVAEGAQIGVHSWGGGPGEIGQELSKDAPEHQRYLDYYRAMGIPTDFYWFTLESAPVDRMHIMTEEEITRYRLRASAAP